MREELARSLLKAMAAVVAVLLLTSVPAAAGQGASPICAEGNPTCEDASRAAGPVPRTSAGKPDLGGRWLRSEEGEGRATNIIEEHPAGYGITAGKSLIIDPTDGRFPYQPWALEERDRRRRDENAYEDPQGNCFLSGVPRIMNFDFEILQFPDYVVLLYEYINTSRVIPLDGRPHLPAGIRLFMSDSRGRWEGDTLVVDTTNFNGETWMALGGDFTSADAHLVERFRMLNADRLSWEATVTDPKVFTRPWTVRYGPFTRDRGPAEEELEDSCHEGNVDLGHLKNTYDAAQEGRRSFAGSPGTGAPDDAGRREDGRALARAMPTLTHADGDFSGRWILAGSSRTSFFSEILIRQVSGELHWEGSASRQDTIIADYKLDGTEVTIPGRDGMVTTSRARLDGERLVITSTRTFPSPAGDMSVDFREVYSVAGDRLTVERTQTVGGISSTLKAIYTK